MQQFLRPFSFSLMGVVVALLIAGSVVEQICGTAVATRYIYTAPWTIAVWTLSVLSGGGYLVSVYSRKGWSNLITFALHFAFVVILAGAMITHLWGKQGNLSIRLGETATIADIPFSVSLRDFHIDYYPGSMAPADFVSEIETEGVSGVVSMNKIFTHRHYRFYQSQYDSDGKGVTLRYSYDPWGIGVTYAGYVLLLLSMIGFFFQRRTRFMALVRQLAVCVLMVVPAIACAKTAVPPTVPDSVSEDWGKLYVYYNDRVCPMRTLAVDFTTKLYGKPSYKGLTAEQVLCGWLFYYDQWAKESCIKIKGKDIRAILGIEGKYACLNDYVGDRQYKLSDAIRQGNRNAQAADEKMQLISQVCTGRMMRIYPVEGQWYSWSDQLPPDIDYADWQYVVRSMDYVALCVAQRNWFHAKDALAKIKRWQQDKLSAQAISQGNKKSYPSAFRFEAERFYKAFHYTRPLAMGCATAGLFLFVLCCMLAARCKSLPKWLDMLLLIGLGGVLAVLTPALALRWIVSGHVPLTNGFETMQFMAWVSACLTTGNAIIGHRSKNNNGLATAAGLLVTGMTLMVSMMSASNPQITNLMPVLQSPLLTLHVAVIMIAYCLLAFIMLNGVAALCVPSIRSRMQVLSQVLLYPAVFLLTIGIFLGAVWANISWGRYWGWDPKETWALITMIVYSLLLHWNLWDNKQTQKSQVTFHICCVAAFLFVLFTYFGVNFLLGGLHSYANS